MKTTCYCIGCKRHPLHNKRDTLVWITDGHRSIYDKKEKESGSEVNCFEPLSAFYDETDIPKDEYQFDSCMYGGGYSQAKSEQMGFTIFAHCENEDHEE